LNTELLSFREIRMADQILDVWGLGTRGVNTDLSPLHLSDEHLRKAQNAISDPLGAEMALTNRPGLTKFNANAAAGPILGGIGVPLLNLHTGSRFFLIGRGAKS
jgi:hypothetical protein